MSVTIPNGVTAIGNSAFYQCSGLTSVTIPNSVTTINDFTFSYCSGLTSVTIPNSVTIIGSSAFRNCKGLTHITIPTSVTIIEGWAFNECTGLTSVTIPNNVKLIGQSSFHDCTSLISVTIPNSVTTIEYAAFRNSGLTTITIPNSVTDIEDYAFNECLLKQIYCEATTPPQIESETFSNIYNTCELYVPEVAYSAYLNDPYWGKFNITKQVITSISDTDAGNLNVYSENGSIIVQGGKLGNLVDIYSVSGSLLQKIKITDHIVRITVAPQKIYIVKTGNKSFKIAM